ncbi:hypothetical protein Misp01_67370 [Microtetraspora sp. NBRC 13810]|uniref:hypothetical protein n=1 Tax=Microtetraspora sp. NBRC 13810 TaxID=3030990 RepID=UPI00249FC02F|nr:hypothetical protein [Microtetraspora sp. NBRC 13810]GLW11609.1 hypothetical protein Misp01_67370 [Microtetraspora sp. NBRC 13810]
MCGIVTFTGDDVPAAEVQRCLSATGINVSVSRVTSARFDLGSRGLPGVIRASGHYYNKQRPFESSWRLPV